MGFNLGSFAAGALKTLSENVKEQSDTQDADAKRYLEAGIAEGKAATKAYRAENKTLKELGSQLDAQGFTNNQIKLVLKGGKASTQNFIKAVSDAKSLGDPTTDVASWVNVSGKPSSASWEDYITTVIQGRPDKDAAESYYIAPKNTSILGSYLNNGSIATGNGNSRYDQQAAKMSAGMGINVKDVVAAGTGNMVYDDANQVSGTIQTKDLKNQAFNMKVFQN
jgi:NACalpha-BTF3-like transcription factor